MGRVRSLRSRANGCANVVRTRERLRAVSEQSARTLSAVVKTIRDWLRQLPTEVANAIVVPLLVVVVIAVVAIVAGFLVNTRVVVWVAVLAFLGGVIAGAVIERPRRSPDSAAEQELVELRHRADELAPYDTYAEHVRDALNDLRKAIRGELTSFSLRDFVEVGVFQTAHRLLSRSSARGDVRFSILHPHGEDFVMANENGLFPAYGHRPESRQKFRLPIAGSFSQLAYARDRVVWSGNLSEDDRFQQHERAAADRTYESIVSVPLRLGAEVDGVMNVIATGPDAFSHVDRTYISLLGSVVDVARSVSVPPQAEQSAAE